MKDWKEELWNKFKSPLGYSSIDNKSNSMYDLESFIQSLLDKKEQEAMIRRKKVKLLTAELNYDAGRKAERKEWKGKIEKLKDFILENSKEEFLDLSKSDLYMNTPKTISEAREDFKNWLWYEDRDTQIFKLPNSDEISDWWIEKILSILDSIPLEEKECGSKRTEQIPTKDEVCFFEGYNQKTREIREWKENVIK